MNIVHLSFAQTQFRRMPVLKAKNKKAGKDEIRFSKTFGTVFNP